MHAPSRGPGTDTELVMRAQGGDLDAFDRLLVRHRARLYRIACEIAGDREAAQDIVQEALVRGFRCLGDLREGGRIGAWLDTIVRRQSQQWLRDGRRRPEPAPAEALRGMPCGVTGPADGTPIEVRERAREALRALSERDRRAMVLHYLEGFSCEEIARKLGLSPGSVKQILFHSRRKARQEGMAMSEAEQVRVGPRKLTWWVDGSPRGVWPHLRPLLAQTVCLAANKRPKTIPELVGEAGAQTGYLEETVTDLLEMEVLAEPKKGRYLTNFLALDGEDWRRLARAIREPAGEVAKRFAAAEATLQAAVEKTPLAAQGWRWEDLSWTVYATLVSNSGASRNESPAFRPPRVDHPGGRYHLGGREETPDFPPVWASGFSCNISPPFSSGCFWSYGLSRRDSSDLLSGGDTAAVAEALADGPRREQELLDMLGDQASRWRGALAELVKEGYVRREGEQYRLAVPVFEPGDSEVLTPVVDAVIAPILREVAEPAFDGVDALLDELGYSLQRGYYAQWHRWLIGHVMGEAVRFLMEQGVLPRPPSPAPATFGCMIWLGELPLMDWGVQ